MEVLVLANITTNPKIIVELLNAANDRQWLRKLRISGVTLPEKAFAKLPDPDEPDVINEFKLIDTLTDHLKASRALRHLNLSHCNLSVSMLVAIP